MALIDLIISTIFEKEYHLRSRRQGGGGSLMMWGAIYGDKIKTLTFSKDNGHSEESESTNRTFYVYLET